MNIEKSLDTNPIEKKIISALKSLKHGEGLTKVELAKKLGFQETIIVKWYRTIPVIKNYRVYIKQGTAYRAIFVNLKYKHELILRGKAKENI